MASLPPRRSLDLSHITWRKCVVDQSDHSGTRQSLHAPTAMSCSYRIVRDCQDDLVADFSTEVSLVAIDSEVPGDEARRWWNCKDTGA